jgi:hypothetical protein
VIFSKAQYETNSVYVLAYNVVPIFHSLGVVGLVAVEEPIMTLNQQVTKFSAFPLRNSNYLVYVTMLKPDITVSRAMFISGL